MDAVYIFRHSPFHDFEIRYSLRSLARYAPYIRKVWIFGDKPRFLSNDKTLIQHVPHEYTARVVGVQTPVTDFSMLMVLASLIPELGFEYLQWSDDHYLLKDYPISEARKTRYHADLPPVMPAAKVIGKWKQTLRFTADTLRYIGYTAYNFETHTPRCLTRKMVFDAYSDLRKFITEEHFAALTGPTAILNPAYCRERMALTRLKDENSMCGFWQTPPSYEDVVEASEGKTFFNFDDLAFGTGIRRFLMEQFPSPSQYERTRSRATRAWAVSSRSRSSAPPGSRSLPRTARRKS